MPIFEAIGELVVNVFMETLIFRLPVRIYEWATGKDTGINGYRTEYKKFIKFDTAKKFLLTWEADAEHVKYKLTEGLEALDQKLDVAGFRFVTIDQRTVVYPPTPISFYSFHFLIEWLMEFKVETIGLVETTRSAYTAYNDPGSENLIGQTDKGKRFFISLMEDYSKRQFLRINRDIKIIEDFDVAKIKSALASANE